MSWKVKGLVFSLVVVLGCGTLQQDSAPFHPAWTHITSLDGQLETPNSGNEQTATAVLDADGDGLLDFVIAERTVGPSIVWYRRTPQGWERYPVEQEPFRIEAGSAVADIDGDGDTDLVFGGDYRSNEVWWWENPSPSFQKHRSWVRRTIKSSGGTKHHDQLFGDFDGDGQEELVFWNQGGDSLLVAEVPEAAHSPRPWYQWPIYSYSTDGEPAQRGEYPGFKGSNEHEGLAKADINGDGKMDIVGGGRWFEHVEGRVYKVHTIDTGYSFTRAAAGQLIVGDRPEVVLVVGDGRGPLILYEWKDEEEWRTTVLVESVQDGHSLEVVDFDRDGNLDIFFAEMRLDDNPEARAGVLLGDGAGNFREVSLLTGFGMHESRVADLDGDGDLDILGKPYTWEAPRLDIWLQD